MDRSCVVIGRVEEDRARGAAGVSSTQEARWGEKGVRRQPPGVSEID